MKRYVIWLGVVFLLASALLLWAAKITTGFTSNALLAVFSASVSVGVALIIVNFLIDQRSRRIAAAPLVRLVRGPIADLHNDFISFGREKFGTAQFNTIIDAYEDNDCDPVAWSPEQRAALSEMIDQKKDQIVKAVGVVDSRLSDVISVLGWSFDAKIISSALHCKQNIAELLARIDPCDEAQRLKRTEMYFDLDTSASYVLKYLCDAIGEDLQLSNQRPPSSDV